MRDLARRILITGGGQRLGAVMAEAVARAGFDVAIHCHRSRRCGRGAGRTHRGHGPACRGGPGGPEPRGRGGGCCGRGGPGAGPARRAGQQCVGLRARPPGHGDPGVLGPPHGNQPARTGGAQPGLRPPAAGGRQRPHRQHAGPAGAEPDAQLPVLQHLEDGPVGGDAGAGARAGAAGAGQRDRPGADAGGTGHEPGGLRGAVPRNAAAARDRRRRRSRRR